MRKQRRVRGNHDDNGASLLADSGLIRVQRDRGSGCGHGDACNTQFLAPAAVALDERPDRVRSGPARGGSDTAFVAEANHPGTAPDSPFGRERSCRRFESPLNVLGLNVEAVCVIEKAVERLRDNGHGPERTTANNVRSRRPFLLNLPLDKGIPDNADAVRIREQDRSVEETGFFDPRCAGHLSVAVQRPPPSEGRVTGGFSCGQTAVTPVRISEPSMSVV